MKEIPGAICERPCKFSNGYSSWGRREFGCNYIGIKKGESRVKRVYEMLGVKTMTKRAREMLLPANCPCFELSDAPIPERVIEVPRKAPEERVEQIRELHAQGLYDREIAAKMGISDRTVGTWRKSLGLESNYKNRNGGDQK